MFHALDLAVKILHFSVLSALQNKPFRSAIADVVFRRLFRKMFKCLSLPYSRKVAKTELYQRELLKKMREVKESKKREKKKRGERKEGKEGALVREMHTPHFRGNGVENAIFNALIRLFLMRRRQP